MCSALFFSHGARLRISDRLLRVRSLFQAFLSHVELRKSEMLKELDSHFNAKKMAMDAYRQKANESMDNLQEVSFVPEDHC